MNPIVTEGEGKQKKIKRKVQKKKTETLESHAGYLGVSLTKTRRKNLFYAFIFGKIIILISQIYENI